MPKLTIDNIALEVPEGTNLLEAARSVGIVIPHFCWHPALGRAGACRVCAVKVLEGTPKGIQMSCMLPAQEGMVVSTTDEEAAALRRSVIEWLMINHPHDCPVCDEGGECQLQDFTIAGGHGIRRYDGRKRTYLNQYLGERIEHEMNRCIQCYRCARFYQEYAGGSDFGVMGRAGMVYFGRQCDGPLESPFSGNLVDICPTGVFTDKTARFRARYWDYDMAPSVCPHCSLGCNTIPAARYRELLKVMARRNDQVNGWFICDRGRFTNGPVNAPQRPRQPLVDHLPVFLEQAVEALAQRLQTFLEQNGPQALAIVASPHLSLEGSIMAARLRQQLGAGALCYFPRQEQADRALAAVSLHPERSASQQDVRSADLIVLAGCDLLDEAPMMALAVRQAWRNGGRIYALAGGAGQAENLPLTREEDLGQAKTQIGADASETLPHPDPPLEGEGSLYGVIRVASLAEVPLTEATRPVLVCGARAESDLLRALPDNLKTALILEGPNGFGCGALGQEQGAVSLEQALASGQIGGVLALEADLPEQLPSQIRILGAADWRDTALVRSAEVVLPTAAWVEMAGTYINYEGRAQAFRTVMQPGLPIKGLDPAGHPPHVFRSTAPGGELLPAWQVLALLMKALGGEAAKPLSGRWQQLGTLDPEGPGLRLGSGG